MCGSAVPCAVDHNIMAMETQKKNLSDKKNREISFAYKQCLSDFCTALIRGRSVALGLLPGKGTSSTSGLYGNAGNPGCVV
jgi:hypothetical protein